MSFCKKCNRKCRLICKRENQKGKEYWIERCIKCKTPITLEPYIEKNTKFKIDD